MTTKNNNNENFKFVGGFLYLAFLFFLLVLSSGCESKQTIEEYRIPDENFRSRITKSGWVHSNDIEVTESKIAYIDDDSIIYNSHEDVLKSNYGEGFGVFIVKNETYCKIYLPLEHKKAYWTALKCLSSNVNRRIKMIPTTIPISAFDEIMKTGLNKDITIFIENYNSSTVITEKGLN